MQDKSIPCIYCGQKFERKKREEICPDCVSHTNAERNRRAREKAETVPAPVDKFLERKGLGSKYLKVVEDPLQTPAGLSCGFRKGQKFPRGDVELMIKDASFTPGSILVDPIRRKYIVPDKDQSIQ